MSNGDQNASTSKGQKKPIELVPSEYEDHVLAEKNGDVIPLTPSQGIDVDDNPNPNERYAKKGARLFTFPPIVEGAEKPQHLIEFHRTITVHPGGDLEQKITAELVVHDEHGKEEARSTLVQTSLPVHHEGSKDAVLDVLDYHWDEMKREVQQIEMAAHMYHQVKGGPEGLETLMTLLAIDKGIGAIVSVGLGEDETRAPGVDIDRAPTLTSADVWTLVRGAYIDAKGTTIDVGGDLGIRPDRLERRIMDIEEHFTRAVEGFQSGTNMGGKGKGHDEAGGGMLTAGAGEEGDSDRESWRDSDHPVVNENWRDGTQELGEQQKLEDEQALKKIVRVVSDFNMSANQLWHDGILAQHAEGGEYKPNSVLVKDLERKFKTVKRVYSELMHETSYQGSQFEMDSFRDEMDNQVLPRMAALITLSKQPDVITQEIGDISTPEKAVSDIPNKPETFMFRGFGLTREVQKTESGKLHQNIILHAGNDPDGDPPHPDMLDSALVYMGLDFPNNAKAMEKVNDYWEDVKYRFERIIRNYDDYYKLKGGSPEARDSFIYHALEQGRDNLLNLPIQELHNVDPQSLSAINLPDMTDSEVTSEARLGLRAPAAKKAGLKMDEVEESIERIFDGGHHKLASELSMAHNRLTGKARNPDFDAALQDDLAVESRVAGMADVTDSLRNMQEISGRFTEQANLLWREYAKNIEELRRAPAQTKKIAALAHEMGEFEEQYTEAKRALERREQDAKDGAYNHLSPELAKTGGLDVSAVTAVSDQMLKDMQMVVTRFKNPNLLCSTIEKGIVPETKK